MKRLFAMLFVAALAAESEAACTLNLQKEDLGRGKRWELSWTPQTGATHYLLESIRTDPETGSTTVRKVEVQPRGGTSRVTREVSMLTTTLLTVTYRVTAVGTAEPCSATIDVTYQTDTATQRQMRKSVIPLVGSVRGAHDSHFKTTIRLRATRPSQRGILVFHPANVPARDTDPYINYFLPATNSVMVIDDLEAAFGVSGLGTIDIIPEYDDRSGWSVPFAEVRVFNVAPSGTFGTIEFQTQAYDYHGDNPDAIDLLMVTVPGPELRVNVGVRSFYETRVTFELVRNGSVIAARDYDLSQDMLFFNSADHTLGTPVAPGDTIIIRIADGGGVPMYSLTDNRTNDPALYMTPTRIHEDVSTYAVGF